jgi:hypothetical protein
LASSLAIPNGLNRDFDHAAFDLETRRVYIAHTARDCLEVIDHDAQKHVATLQGCPGVAGELLTTNRGAATITSLDATTYAIKGVSRRVHGPMGRPSSRVRASGSPRASATRNKARRCNSSNLKEVTQ